MARASACPRHRNTGRGGLSNARAPGCASSGTAPTSPLGAGMRTGFDLARGLTASLVSTQRARGRLGLL